MNNQRQSISQRGGANITPMILNTAAYERYRRLMLQTSIAFVVVTFAFEGIISHAMSVVLCAALIVLARKMGHTVAFYIFCGLLGINLVQAAGTIW